MKDIKWILFDFGGCLDSDGLHSRVLFFNQYLKCGLVNEVSDYSDFQEAYTFSDNLTISGSLLLNAKLLEMNNIMCTHLSLKLGIKNINKTLLVSKKITQVQSFYLRRNKQILKKLSLHYKLGIISNFSGNLTTILDEFSIAEYFNFVLDSYHVGASKPSPVLFNMAIAKTGTSSEKICFIGDNIERDIIPAKNLGMKSILISNENQRTFADFNITSLTELLPLTQII